MDGRVKYTYTSLKTQMHNLERPFVLDGKKIAPTLHHHHHSRRHQHDFMCLIGAPRFQTEFPLLKDN